MVFSNKSLKHSKYRENILKFHLKVGFLMFFLDKFNLGLEC